MTRDDFNRNSRIVSAILNATAPADDPRETRSFPALADRAAEASADPFVSPKHKGTIFYNHSCVVCNDGERPCREGKPNLCGNPRARND